MTSDLKTAHDLAVRFVAAGLGRIRQVYLTGSRALGNPRPDSDYDLVVVVELPATERPWGPPEIRVEKKRLLAAAGELPVRVDLSVRTTDRMAEAGHVFGGVEWFATTQGVLVYQQELSRPANARKSSEQVRRELMSAWIEHAHGALSRGLAADRHIVNEPDAARAHKDRLHLPRRCVERCVTAILVLHDRHCFKHEGLDAMLEMLAPLEPQLTARIRAALSRGINPAAATAVLRIVVQRVLAEPAAAPYVKKVSDAMSRPIIVFGEPPAVAGRVVAAP